MEMDKQILDRYLIIAVLVVSVIVLILVGLNCCCNKPTSTKSVDSFGVWSNRYRYDDIIQWIAYEQSKPNPDKQLIAWLQAYLIKAKQSDLQEDWYKIDKDLATDAVGSKQENLILDQQNFMEQKLKQP